MIDTLDCFLHGKKDVSDKDDEDNGSILFYLGI